MQLKGTLHVRTKKMKNVEIGGFKGYAGGIAIKADGRPTGAIVFDDTKHPVLYSVA